MFYSQTVGRPPVVSGVLTKKKKGKFSKGHTRGQHVLVKAAGPHLSDYKTPFLVVMAVWYCHIAKPGVEEGTDAAHAVLAVMLEDGTCRALLSTVCVIQICYQGMSLMYVM